MTVTDASDASMITVCWFDDKKIVQHSAFPLAVLSMFRGPTPGHIG